VRELIGPIVHSIPGGEYLEIENLLECRQLDYQSIQEHCERVKERCRKDAITNAHLRVLMLERQELQELGMQAHIDKEVRNLLRSYFEVSS
jgi:ribosomal protein S14